MKQISLKYAIMMLAISLLVSCGDKGEDAPHPAVLYNICDIAEAEDGSTLFHLYRPDANLPIILTANEFSAVNNEGTLPAVGTSGLLAYIPISGKPYEDGEIAVSYWASINNFELTIPAEDEAVDFLADWDAEAVDYLAGWRGGNKIYLRLRLPYSTIPRRFGLVVDPSTLSDPFPTLYLCHQREDDSPTFDRQYYFAFDISELWQRPEVEGVRMRVNDHLYGQLREFQFNKTLVNQ